MVKCVVCSLILVIGFSQLVFAGRPLATEDAWVAKKRQVLLEISWDSSRWSDDLIESVPLFILFYGITNNVQISFGLPVVILDGSHRNTSVGIGDADISMKYKFTNPKKGPAVSLMSTFKSRTGHARSGHGSGAIHLSTLLAATQELGQTVVSSMFGYTYSESHDNLLFYGLGVEHPLSSRWMIGAEIIGEEHLQQTVFHSLSGLAGMAYTLSGNLVLDSGYRIGFTDSAPIWNFTVGLSAAF